MAATDTARKSFSETGPNVSERPLNEAGPLAERAAEVAASLETMAPLLRAIPTTCIEHQAGRPTVRLSFQIKVF